MIYMVILLQHKKVIAKDFRSYEELKSIKRLMDLAGDELYEGFGSHSRSLS